MSKKLIVKKASAGRRKATDRTAVALQRRKTSSKSGKKAAAAARPRKTTALHQKLIDLMRRKSGATIQDTSKAGFHAPAIQAMRLVEHRGYKVHKVKKDGELTRYYATKK